MCPGQVDRVPRVGGLPCLACKRFNAFSKEMCEKLALKLPHPSYESLGPTADSPVTNNDNPSELFDQCH